MNTLQMDIVKAWVEFDELESKKLNLDSMLISQITNDFIRYLLDHSVGFVNVK